MNTMRIIKSTILHVKSQYQLFSLLIKYCYTILWNLMDDQEQSGSEISQSLIYKICKNVVRKSIIHIGGEVLNKILQVTQKWI